MYYGVNYLTNDYGIYHHGVKGMKWGVRNTKKASRRPRQTSSARKVKSKSSKNIRKALKIGAAIITGVGVGALALSNPTFSSAAMSVNAIMNAPVATLNLTNRVAAALDDRG